MPLHLGTEPAMGQTAQLGVDSWKERVELEAGRTGRTVGLGHM